MDLKRKRNLVVVVLTCLTSLSCSREQPNAEIQPIIPPASLAGPVDFMTQVKPILDNRCVVCHGCFEAPCQVKLVSPAGIARGAFDEPVYEHERLFAAEPTRLGQDAQTTNQWRNIGFYPIVPDLKSDGATSTLLLQSILQKQQHPLPTTQQLGDEFTLGINRENACPTSDEYQQDIAKKNPLWGMPYGLPGLSKSEHSTLLTWISQGATLPNPQGITLSDSNQKHIAALEAFLNSDTLKNRLVARYLYEHLFLANLYFEQTSTTRYFKMYRSSTPPGEVAKIIATRRPYDDPKVDRIYYRILPLNETVTLKNHLPYLVDRQRLDFWHKLFIEPDYTVSKLPGYSSKTTANPFKSFEALPERARYQFLLSEAKFTIMNFIKGPVCRGGVSLNVIRDQFWVFFLSPDSAFNKGVSEQLAQHQSLLELVSQEEDVINIPGQWLKYYEQEKKLQLARDELLLKQAQKGFKIGASDIWNGDGVNQNAALTIFRHHDNASVEQGLLGKTPNTLWLVDYPLLERIHYLLVAGYDVYGNIGHHVLSRIQMDFLRMDGERNFLLLLPEQERARLRQYWYRDAAQDTIDYLTYPKANKILAPNLAFTTDNPKQELIARIKARLKLVISQSREFDALPDFMVKSLNQLEGFQGKNVAFLPDVALIQAPGTPDYQFTLIKNRAHTNLDSLFNEDERLVPAEFSVSVTKGITSAYPNALFFVPQAQFSDFSTSLTAIASDEDYKKVLDQWGIRRTHPDFWRYSDQMHRTKYSAPVSDDGMLDYGRLENR